MVNKTWFAPHPDELIASRYPEFVSVIPLSKWTRKKMLLVQYPLKSLRLLIKDTVFLLLVPLMHTS